MTIADDHRLATTPRPFVSMRPSRAARTQPSMLGRLLLLTDVVSLSVAWWAATLRYAPSGTGRLDGMSLLRVATIVLACIALLAGHKLYLGRACAIRPVMVARLGRVAAITAALAYVLEGSEGTRSLAFPVAGAVLSLLFLTTSREFYETWLRVSRATGRFTRPVLVVGADIESANIVHLLEHHPELGYRVAAFTCDTENVISAMRDSGAAGVVVASSGMSSAELNRVVRTLLDAGIHVHLSSGLMGIDHRRVRALPFAHEPMFYVESAERPVPQVVLKRMLDLVVASVVLLVTAPLLICAAIAIKLHDHGDVFFRQERVGRDGESFTLLKLRTMVPDAESRIAALEDQNERDGPLFKVSHDPRVTPLGRLLRASSIDELPQLFNVLRGKMSLVGPRPALPDEVAQFDDELMGRHSVLPGLTGLWQVEARDNESFFAYRHLDLFYVENWSLALDLVILFETVPSVLARAFRGVLSRSTVEVEPATTG